MYGDSVPFTYLSRALLYKILNTEWKVMNLSWLLDGINKSIPRYGGPECANYLNLDWRYVESSIVLLFAIWLIKWSYSQMSLPDETYVTVDRVGGRILLAMTCLIFGMEIAFKCATRTMIDILNPCHMTTITQIYLLTASPSKLVTALFRIHLNFMNGPLLAYIFPEIQHRELPLQYTVYWIQHGLMLIVPFYLFRIGGVYNAEEISDLSWSAMSFAFNLLLHFFILQEIAIPTEVNLSHMLCPALKDPFQGQLFRLFAIMHQAFLCPFLSKFYYVTADFFLTKFKHTKVKSKLSSPL